MANGTVGARLRAARLRRGMTLTRVSELCEGNPTRQTLSNWEHDHHAPNFALLERVAQVVGIEFALLLNGDPRTAGLTYADLANVHVDQSGALIVRADPRHPEYERDPNEPET